MKDPFLEPVFGLSWKHMEEPAALLDMEGSF